jgi:hypothetical protein
MNKNTMTEKYEELLTMQQADAIMKQNAINHQKQGESGYPPLVKIGYYGIFRIVARCEYDQWNKSFAYDGGLESGGGCDRNGGYKSIN